MYYEVSVNSSWPHRFSPWIYVSNLVLRVFQGAPIATVMVCSPFAASCPFLLFPFTFTILWSSSEIRSLHPFVKRLFKVTMTLKKWTYDQSSNFRPSSTLRTCDKNFDKHLWLLSPTATSADFCSLPRKRQKSQETRQAPGSNVDKHQGAWDLRQPRAWD